MEGTIQIPALALRGLVVLDHMTVSFDVGRKRSLAALRAVSGTDKKIFLTAQKELDCEDPDEDDLYEYGVIASVRQLMRSQDGSTHVQVQGETRARLQKIAKKDPYLLAEIIPDPVSCEPGVSPVELDALMRVVRHLFEQYSMNLPKPATQLVMKALDEDSPDQLFELIAFNMLMDYDDKQTLLECDTIAERLGTLGRILSHESQLLELEKDLYEQVKSEMDKNQRDYFLREQMQVIQNELNEGIPDEDDPDTLIEKIRSFKTMPKETCDKLVKEAEKLEKMPMGSQEASVIRSYLDTCLELPWDEKTEDTIDLKKAKKLLDRDHYGLDKVKDRILEALAVRKLQPEVKGQILCLVGPPGVGKTSIGRCIAETMGRKYVRLSLGGVKDESDIRGHRKTYIGSMPGRIISALRQAKVKNPLILLDEIDKMSNDFRGDPSSAMLEVLDSEQNNEFRDHYIEVPFDLSDVFFITTANDASAIPGPLLDRMELIELSSYTREEKYQIAKRHLTAKQLKKHGLTAQDLSLTSSALYGLIDYYTREAGVRGLERTIGSLCRKVARKKVEDGEAYQKIRIGAKDLEEYLGPKKFSVQTLPEKDPVGLVTGLAWTSVGGETLEIEAAVMPGTGKLEITGNLGNVMTESARLAVSYVRTIADQYGIDPDFYKTKDIHIHAPEGAVPKDGPSAGVTITTALVSALSGIPVRRDLAMTGEISLRGRVMQIGGLKEKSIAAYRSGVKTVLIPAENEPDIAQFDEIIRDNLEFHPVKTLDEVLALALVQKKDMKTDIKPSHPYKKISKEAPEVQA